MYSLLAKDYFPCITTPKYDYLSHICFEKFSHAGMLWHITFCFHTLACLHVTGKYKCKKKYSYNVYYV